MFKKGKYRTFWGKNCTVSAWDVKAGKGRRLLGKHDSPKVSEESSVVTLDHQPERRTGGSGSKRNLKHCWRQKATKLKLPDLGRILRRQRSLEKTVTLGKQKAAGRQEDQIWDSFDSIKEAIITSLQELSKPLGDRTLFTSLLHRVARSQRWLNST